VPHRVIQYAAGEYYHIYNRGSGRQPIFQEADNYLLVLRLLKEYSARLGVTVVAYCLMPNHYHFLLRQDGEQPISLLIQRIFNAYTKAYNKRYGRSGTLFQGRYRAVHVDRENYLVQLCRYIHANPVKGGLVSHVQDWPYSNYREWIGDRMGTLVDRSLVQSLFQRAEDYEHFVEDYVSGESKLPPGVDEYLIDEKPR